MNHRYPDRQPEINKDHLDSETGKGYWRIMDERLKKLTNLEARVIELIHAGRTNREMAQELSSTEGAIHVNIYNIKRRLGVNSIADIIKIWQKLKVEKMDLTSDPDNLGETLP